MHKPLTIFASFVAGSIVAGAVAVAVFTVKYDSDNPLYGLGGNAKAPADPAIYAIRISRDQFIDADVEGSRLRINKRTSLLGNHNDLYLKVRKRDGTIITTKPYIDTPVGNGLEWFFEPPMMMSELYRVEIWDSNMVSDTLLDQVLIDGRSQQGDYFMVSLLTDNPQHPLEPINSQPKPDAK